MRSKFLTGLIEGFHEGREKYALPELDERSKDDIKDYVDDENLPVTEKESAAEPVRTISEALDFLGYVAEETLEWIERETGLAAHPRDPMPRPRVTRSTILPAANWRVTRVALANEIRQIEAVRDDRRSIRLVNWGPDPVYVGRDSWVPGTDPSPNTLLVPVSVSGTSYFPVDLPTTQELWAGTLVTDTAVLEMTVFFENP